MLIKTNLVYEDMLKLFADNEIYYYKDYMNKPGLELKTYGDYFKSNSNLYGNNYELSKKNITLIGNNFGRILLHEWFFFYFPQYFVYYDTSVETLLMEDEYLPINWRFYIAIMAASTMRCDYLIRVCEDAFLFYGGEEKWLMYGLDTVPEKLKRLGKINNILAHQPWKIRNNDLEVRLL